MAFEFATDTYRWTEDRQFVLEEPPPLFGESPFRTDVQERRVNAGWQLISTNKADAKLTLTDLWTRQSPI